MGHPTMNCDGCGQELSRENTPEFDTYSEQIGTTGIAGAFTRTKGRWLCPACATYHRQTRQMLWWLAAGIIGGLVLIGLWPR